MQIILRFTTMSRIPKLILIASFLKVILITINCLKDNILSVLTLLTSKRKIYKQMDLNNCNFSRRIHCNPFCSLFKIIF